MSIDSLSELERILVMRGKLIDQAFRERMLRAANSLKATNDRQARIEVMTEALYLFTGFLYTEKTSTGTLRLVGVDTCRVLCSVPWSRHSCTRYGLYHNEAELLRKIMLKRTVPSKGTGAPALLDYNQELLSWHLNLYDYPDIDQALKYWERRPISLEEYEAQARVQQQRFDKHNAARKDRRKGKK